MFTDYIACPNCGSTAQPRLKKTEAPAQDKIRTHYECGCGCHFVAIYKIREIYEEFKK